MRALDLPAPKAYGRLIAVLLALPLLVAVVLLPSGAASAATAPVDQCSSILNQGGQAVRCTVTVVNTLNAPTGIGSSTVTVQQCTGAIGAPTCSAPVTTSAQDVVAAVSQCNGSASGGGGESACTVDITNNITGGAAPTPATIDQCVGSADGSGTMNCTPLGSTSGATVTQCNGSGNGGGSTVTCTVAPGSTQSASLLVKVNQCNGSANGGGSLVTCRTSITNNMAAAPAPSASPSAIASASSTPVASATPTPTPSGSALPSTSASPSTNTSPSAPALPTTVPSAPSVVPPAAPGPPAVVPPAAPGPTAAPGSTGPVGTAPSSTTGPGVSGASGGPPVITSTPSLPRTGSDTGILALLGAVTTAVGAGLLLAGRQPRGRHALR